MIEIDDIKDIVCAHYKLSETEFHSVGRDDDSRLPRMVFVLSCARAGHNDLQIAIAMGKARYSIQHIRKRASDRYKTDLHFMAAVKRVELAAKPKDKGEAVIVPADIPDEQVPMSVLQDLKVVAEARKLRRQGWSYQGLSKRFRISPQQAAILVGDRPDAAGVDRHG